MTGSEVLWNVRREGWLFNDAPVKGVRTARMKGTATRHPERAREFSFNCRDNALFCRVEVGGGRKERLRIGMLRLGESRFSVSNLHDVSQVHHGHAM